MASTITPIDRGARIAVGLGIFSLVFIERTWLGLIGFYPLVTAVFDQEPIYTWLRRVGSGRN